MPKQKHNRQNWLLFPSYYVFSYKICPFYYQTKYFQGNKTPRYRPTIFLFCKDTAYTHLNTRKCYNIMKNVYKYIVRTFRTCNIRLHNNIVYIIHDACVTCDIVQCDKIKYSFCLNDVLCIFFIFFVCAYCANARYTWHIVVKGMFWHKKKKHSYIIYVFGILYTYFSNALCVLLNSGRQSHD